MSDEYDDYLWTGEGAAPADVATLERELRSLAWSPRPLALPAPAQVVPIRGDDEMIEQQRPRAANDRRGWAPIFAALAAAAAVLAVFAWLRSPSEHPPREPDSTTTPAVQPAGRPSPDLKDPFAKPDAEQGPSVSPSLVDPFAPEEPQPAPRRRVSPDLKDPFANSASSSTFTAPSAPADEPDRGVDLVDPFGGSGQRDRKTKQRKPGKLYDPFTGKQSERPRQPSPDLKDPFTR